MADAVGVAVHHEEGVLPARDHEMSGVVAGPGRVRQEIRVRCFLLEILDPPGAPERLDLRLRELHQVLQDGRETTNQWAKVEQAFRVSGRGGNSVCGSARPARIPGVSWARLSISQPDSQPRL